MILKVLDFLEDEGLIDKEWRSSTSGKPYAVYKSTAAPFVYRGAHYEEIKQIRYRELEQMQTIANTSECLSRTVVSLPRLPVSRAFCWLTEPLES